MMATRKGDTSPPAPKKKRAKKESGTRTYLVDQGGGRKFKVTIPDNFRITFGPWAPPSKNSRGYSHDYVAQGTLRIYEGTSIRACYSPVVSFHDLSLEPAHLTQIKKGDMSWIEDSKGNFEKQEKLLVENTWEDADLGE